MADYYAVQSGSSSSGYLVTNGQVYPATSGGPTLQTIPDGSNLTYGDDVALSQKDVHGMSDGTGNKGGFRKFHIGTGPKGSGTIPDKTLGRDREGIDFHFDGGNPGTAGCIGYQDRAAQDALIADPDKTVGVHYEKDMSDVLAGIEKQLGHKVDWSKVKTVKPPAKGPGPQSKTKKGKKVKKGNATVLLGGNKRETAHKTSPLEGGGKVADSSKTVYVGKHLVARVDDGTTDGSPLANGEPSILVG